MMKIPLVSFLLLIILTYALRSAIHWYFRINETIAKLEEILSELRNLRSCCILVALSVIVLTLASCAGGGGSAGGSINSTTSATIGPGGGSITSVDGKTTINIPQDAFSSDTLIKIEKVDDSYEQLGALYKVYGDNVDSFEFSKRVNISVTYDPASLPTGILEDNLVIGLLGPFDSWEILDDSTVDKMNKTIKGTTTHFSSIGILGNRAASSPPKFGFPLPNRNASSVAINSVFDLSMDPKKPYWPDNVVKAYTGEIGNSSKTGGVVIGGQTLYSWSNSSMIDFVINGNYTGGEVGKKYLSYDGHPGYDFRTTDQDPVNGQINVLAAAGGIAIVPATSKFGTVLIDHENGYVTGYLHLSRIDVASPGSRKRVYKGNVIGISGKTAPPEMNIGPHLHFQVMKGIEYVDPYTEGLWEYTTSASAPTFSPLPGTYATAQSVMLSTTTPGATIRYTTDGLTPSSTVGTVYTGPISVSTSMTIKAVAYLSGWTDSPVSTGVYTIITFVTSDLQGTWNFHLLTSGDSPQWLGWGYGQVNVNSSGGYTWTSITRSDGDSSLPSPGTFSITSSGIVSVSGYPSFHGVMSQDKKRIVATANDGGGGYDLIIFQKSGGTFTTSDLQGTWNYHGLVSGDAPAQTPGWYWGVLTADSSCNISFPSPINDSLGNSTYTPGGITCNMSSAGIVTIPGMSEFQGVLGGTKDIFFSVATMAPGSISGVKGYNMQVWNKSGGTFTTSDLQGTWNVHLLTSGDSPQALGWAYGQIDVNSNGGFTWTSMTRSNGDSSLPSPGAFTITSSGILPGAGGGSFRGTMSQDKKMIVATMDDGGGGYNLIIYQK